MLRAAGLPGLFALLASITAAMAEPVACPHEGSAGTIIVDAADAETRARVCAASDAAVAHLASCGLVQIRPVTIEIRPRIDGPAENCAGLYVCGSDRIALIPPHGVAAVMPPDSVFANLDRDAYYDSLVVHELAHAVMDQKSCTLARCMADTEYVAYAMQIGSLPEPERQKIEAWRALPDSVPTERLNDLLLYMKPDIFAVTAWAHFASPGNGCAFVAKLVNGEATLALPLWDN